MRRLVLAGLVLLLLAPGPARAAGTGGIEVSPYPGVVDGHQVTAFHVRVPTRGTVAVRYSLRNTTDHEVTGRLYAASATSDGHGGWTVGDAGSSPYVGLADQRVRLRAHETRLASFPVHGAIDGTRYAAVVVEVQEGAVVTRAATLVYLQRGRRVPLPVLLVGAALLLALLAGAAVAVTRRRQRPATPAG